MIKSCSRELLSLFILSWSRQGGINVVEIPRCVCENTPIFKDPFSRKKAYTYIEEILCTLNIYIRL